MKKIIKINNDAFITSTFVVLSGVFVSILGFGFLVDRVYPAKGFSDSFFS